MSTHDVAAVVHTGVGAPGLVRTTRYCAPVSWLAAGVQPTLTEPLVGTPPTEADDVGAVGALSASATEMALLELSSESHEATAMPRPAATKTPRTTPRTSRNVRALGAERESVGRFMTSPSASPGPG